MEISRSNQSSIKTAPYLIFCVTFYRWFTGWLMVNWSVQVPEVSSGIQNEKRELEEQIHEWKCWRHSSAPSRAQGSLWRNSGPFGMLNQHSFRKGDERQEALAQDREEKNREKEKKRYWPCPQTKNENRTMCTPQTSITSKPRNSFMVSLKVVFYKNMVSASLNK